MAVRTELQDIFPDSEIREFTGGTYDRNLILDSDIAFMTAESSPVPMEKAEKMSISIGRGLYTEAELMLQKSRETSQPCIYYCHFKSDINEGFTIHQIRNAKITDINNYIRYGEILVDMESKSFAEIV